MDVGFRGEASPSHCPRGNVGQKESRILFLFFLFLPLLLLFFLLFFFSPGFEQGGGEGWTRKPVAANDRRYWYVTRKRILDYPGFVCRVWDWHSLRGDVNGETASPRMSRDVAMQTDSNVSPLSASLRLPTISIDVTVNVTRARVLLAPDFSLSLHVRLYCM